MFESSVDYVDKVFMMTVWASCLLFFEPVIKAGLAKVMSTAFSEVRVTKNFVADPAVEMFGYRLGKCEVIASILSLIRAACYSHSRSDLECSFVRRNNPEEEKIQ